ncbi:dicarboxylate/amino acid:cation symporter [Hyphomonas sp.]|uniref:dicarboxylate/amino acid:cation symporter n=1 Tax=Hyphomonas sp. TaxID=87 RepID=UPI0025BB1ED5|nr:dicarboxylate/amino acid:cation symporter [Hyphomonas sp.]
MSRWMFWALIGALILGIAVGGVVYSVATPEQATAFADGVKILSDIFLRLIKMIVAPLILTTLAVGIAHIGGGAALGRIGVRTMAWFIAASLVSLSIGLVMANVLHPGVGFDTTGLDAAKPELATGSLTFREFITHVVPTSIIDAMARNEVLQIVVFSIFLGAALQALGPQAQKVTDLLEQGAFVMLKITGYVMVLAPVAVFAAIANVVALKGLGVLTDYARLVGSFYLGVGVLWAVLIAAGFVVLKGRVFPLIAAVRDPLLIAFSTASSEAALPKLLERLERFGVANRVASFVVPLGYSFNLDGSMMYCTFAVLFIAQALGVEMTLAQQIILLLMLMVTSKGIAGVPRASLVVIAATLPTFNMPAEAIGLVLAVDAFMDMGRTATNVIGNSIASAVVAKWEGVLYDPKVDEIPLAETLDNARS